MLAIRIALQVPSAVLSVASPVLTLTLLTLEEALL